MSELAELIMQKQEVAIASLLRKLEAGLCRTFLYAHLYRDLWYTDSPWEEWLS